MSYSSIIIKGNVRLYASDLTDVVETAITKHQSSPLSSLVLARAITAFAPFAIIKARGRTSAVIKTSGAIRSVVVESKSTGGIRALVGDPHIATEYDGQLDKDINTIPLALAVAGTGTLRIVHEYRGENFGGEVPLANGDITSELALYFAQSEQIRTAVIIDVHFNRHQRIARAYSVIFQMLPGFEESDIIGLENFIAKHQLSAMSLGAYITAFGGSALGGRELYWECTCSLGRMRELAELLDKQERAQLIAEYGAVEITCNFCNSKYRIG